MLGMGGGSLIAGKVGYAVACAVAAVVLVVSGVAYRTVSLVNGLGGGIGINNGASVGAMNILLMGLESRTDYQGRTLSAGLLAAMHAGSVYGVNNLGVGGQATNTLILLHIFAGGQKAVGFSIPRDDWVTYPQAYDGQSQGKIDQAYGLAYAQSLSATVNSSMSSDQRYLQANQAGQAATLATVSAVTGQKIDHFAEVNLAGFYYLAGAFGGIEACIKPAAGDANLHDANSGFNAVLDGYNVKKGGAQYLHLSAPQALAFVRERDNLPNGDLDRTHRQQAVLDYVIWKLEHNNILSDIGQLTGLLNTAKQYLITDSTWNLLDFAPQMKALTGKNLQFYTAPIVGYATIAGQAANQVDIPTIQAAISAKFTAPAPAAKSTTTAKTGAKAAPVPPRVVRHRGRLQRRQRAGPGHRGLAGAGRQGLQGRPGHQRVGPVAVRRRGHPGVLRLGHVRQRGQDRGLLRRDRQVAHVADRGPRRGAPRHRRHRGAGSLAPASATPSAPSYLGFYLGR